MVQNLKIKTEICNYFCSLLSILTICAFLYSCVPVRKSHYNDIFSGLGVQIRNQRIQKGFTLKELAIAVKMSEQNLRLIEKGLATPVYPKLIALQEFLDKEFILDN